MKTENILSIASSGDGDFRFSPLQESDIPFLLTIRNECRDFLHDNREFSIQDATRWFQIEKPMFWIIAFRGQRIGYFRASDYSPANESITLGADIHVDQRGRGLGYLSWQAFLDSLFLDNTIFRVALEVLETNPRAVSLYTKLGFVTEGIKRQAIRRDNIRINSILMSLLKSDWKRSKTSVIKEKVGCF